MNEETNTSWTVTLPEGEPITKGLTRRDVLNSMGLAAGAGLQYDFRGKKDAANPAALREQLQRRHARGHLSTSPP